MTTRKERPDTGVEIRYRVPEQMAAWAATQGGTRLLSRNNYLRTLAADAYRRHKEQQTNAQNL